MKLTERLAWFMLAAMSILVVLLAITLGGLAVNHTLWGIGYWFPIRSEGELVKAVIGGRGVTRMPGPIPCSMVAAGMLIVIGALFGRGYWLSDLILWAAAAVFAARGLMSWMPIWRKMTPQEPFATYDQKFYGPLCLLLALGLTAVAV